MDVVAIWVRGINGGHFHSLRDVMTSPAALACHVQQKSVVAHNLVYQKGDKGCWAPSTACWQHACYTVVGAWWCNYWMQPCQNTVSANIKPVLLLHGALSAILPSQHQSHCYIMQVKHVLLLVLLLVLLQAAKLAAHTTKLLACNVPCETGFALTGIL
jgi:hypothetical protein